MPSIPSSNVRSRTPRAADRGETPTGSVLDTVESTFRLLCTGPDPLAVECARLGHGLPRRRVPLLELRAVLLHPSTSFAARDAVWRELVIAAQTSGPAWVVGAAGVALPGLRKAAGRLAAGYCGEVADIDAELLAGFTARLKTIDPESGSLAARLVWAGQRAGAKLRAREWDLAGRTVPQSETAEPRQQPQPQGHPDVVLAEAVRDRVLTRDDAALIMATRLEKQPVSAVARQRGQSYFRVYRARERAEAALAAWLGVTPGQERCSPGRKKSA